MTHQHEILPIENVETTSRSPRRGGEEDMATPATPALGERAGVVEAPNASGSQVPEHWKAIQGRFVDDPRGSVADARALVDDLIQHVLRSFTEQRESLDRQWTAEASVSTEQLRVCLQQYRALFTQLLPVVPQPSAMEAGPTR